ncbi:hypothetical protein KUCAC02_000189 [Chaenocephalus aceratus]|uniref:Uncharacterized protein n=1 Tax=Chaenocephalus aceratus TaxID=36190 RepID=A0ACB9W551_CHAAC|nr:hypothetical protein KUCAC02_000189 [Chaenocephalus aceratus]
MIGPMKMRTIIHARMNALIIVCSCLCITFTGASDIEKSLHQKLFKNYNMKVRACSELEAKVMVRVGMTLSQLVSLNEKNEEMTTNVFMNMAWIDYRLSWTQRNMTTLQL